MSNPFFSLSLSHESDEVVILSAAGAKDLLVGGARESRSFATRAGARSAQDDMLAAFAVIEEGRICG